MRPILSEQKLHPQVQNTIEAFHSEVVTEVDKAITQNEWVIVGMSGNPFVKRARKHLEKKGISFKYIEYGSYFSKWHERLAIKLWSGWPTFPQVFHKGTLIGGFEDMKKYSP
jgi:glutaredoxin-related protein